MSSDRREFLGRAAAVTAALGARALPLAAQRTATMLTPRASALMERFGLRYPIVSAGMGATAVPARRSLRRGGLILAVGTVVLMRVVAAAGAQERSPVVTTQIVRFVASSLAGEQAFSILLPSAYHQTHARYPVVYLLHGLPQDHTAFSNRPWFAEQAARGVIIVTPNGRDSWYVNSAASPEERYEDFIIKDLIPYVDTHYRTIGSRQGRAIAGISMGGWGAALLGLKHHRLFGAVGMFSAPFAISRLSMPESEMSEKTQ